MAQQSREIAAFVEDWSLVPSTCTVMQLATVACKSGSRGSATLCPPQAPMLIGVATNSQVK